MKNIYLFIVSCLVGATACAQPSDFLVIKKNQRIVKSFFAGSNIIFATGTGSYSGQITAVNKDSLYINQYDIRQVPTNLGVYVVDTVATYRLRFNYKEITKIARERGKGFDWAASGGTLLGGGGLLAVVGLGTWIFAKPGTRYHASTGLVVGSAALAGIGYLLLKSNGSFYTIGEKYRLEYLRMK